MGEGRAPEEGVDTAKAKKVLEKKLRQICELEERRKRGDVLNEDQVAKSKKHLSDELFALNNPGYRAEEPQPEAEEAPVVEEEIPPATSIPTTKKAIEKKLRQIAELEERRAHGEALNEDQLLKLRGKRALEAALRTYES